MIEFCADMDTKAKIPPAKAAPSDEAAIALAKKELEEKRRQNNIALTGVVVTFIVAVISLGWNSLIQKQATDTSEALERTRVATGEFETLSNDFAHPWAPWTEAVSFRTMALGVRRDVSFERPFRKPPNVTLGLSALDFPDMISVLSRLGFTSKDGGMLGRLRHINVTTEVRDVTLTGFRVRIGIGLPTEAAKFLEPRLADSVLVDKSIVADMRAARMLENHEQLTSDEVWMTNFYTNIGSFVITWIAQAEEVQAKGK